ncbi:putative retrotransposon hot spot (RHS) protein [Trypanosoma cruzi]|uniref:Putative retrotransposon hot spot (RHS) protein n=1 Tax=Trypanosoma cruzi TaxID=5693 RepID=A0A2V2UPV6_TRYCR|nr:putative retrotransposon hot spot (RHS) protein [Trypanosoma cruzi]
MSSTVEEILLEGNTGSTNMKLNDFFTVVLDGRGVVDTNENVLLEACFKDPTSYIRDAGVLGEIQASDHYVRMQRTVRDEVDMEYVRRLYKNCVNHLLRWSEAAAEVTANVHDITHPLFGAAAEEARNPTAASAPRYLEGVYESVYNARWHHVVEVFGVEGTGLEVREGTPPQSWTYKAVGYTLEKDDAVKQSDAAPIRLMVLTSDKGWPYSWREDGSTRGCHVNCEAERVWQIVKRDLTAWLNTLDLITNSSSVRRLLIGTPGIGKSMAAGLCFLYQLLHCDVEKLQVAAHCFGGGEACVFEKAIQTVTKYVDEEKCIMAVRSLGQRETKGYIIYDVATKETQPEQFFFFLLSYAWGMIAVSSPKLSNCDEWERQMKAERIIMNCPDEKDVKAMCVDNA